MEYRPRTTRPCPVPGCDWTQITSWYVGNPNTVREESRSALFDDAARHMETHYGPARTWFT